MFPNQLFSIKTDETLTKSAGVCLCLVNVWLKHICFPFSG